MSEELATSELKSVYDAAPEEETAPAPTPEVPATEAKVEEAVTEKSSAPPGFMSKEDWVKKGGDPDEWRSPREFKERGQLIGTVSKLKTDLEESKAAIRMLAESNKRIEEQTRQKAYEELKRAQLDAARIGDERTVEAITDKMIEVKEQQFKPQQPVFNEQTNMQAAIRHEASEFANRNSSWFKVDSRMTSFAHAEELRLLREQPNLGYNPKALLEEVEKSVKDVFKDKFVNTKRAEPVAVESSEGKPSAKSKLHYGDLKGTNKVLFDQVKRAHPRYTIEDFERDMKAEGAL